jgi:hypothetical protein
MADIANFLAQNSPRFNRAAQDRSHFGNALLQNDVDRLPQRNAAEDAAIAADQQAVGQDRQTHARKMAADIFTAIADAPDPISTGAMLTQSGAFRSVGADLGLPVDQFKPTQGDDPEQIRAAARSWAQAVGHRENINTAKPSALVEQYEIARQQGYAGSLLDFQQDLSQRQVGAQFGAPTNVGGAVVAPNRVDPSRNITLSSPEDEAAAAAARAAATTTATTTAQAEAEMQNLQRANERTLGVWNVARDGLISALSGTTTGPISGRMPAVTANQQIADGAIASVAPVLKQLFRSAGEGVFTDRDQDLLNAMIPTRQDHPETRVAKMQMIDAIIQAKLAGGAASGGPQVGTVQDGYRFLGGDPSQPANWQKVQ